MSTARHIEQKPVNLHIHSLLRKITKLPEGSNINEKLLKTYKFFRLAPMWQQSGTLLFCSCHGITGFLVDELQI